MPKGAWRIASCTLSAFAVTIGGFAARVAQPAQRARRAVQGSAAQSAQFARRGARREPRAGARSEVLAPSLARRARAKTRTRFAALDARSARAGRWSASRG